MQYINAKSHPGLIASQFKEWRQHVERDRPPQRQPYVQAIKIGTWAARAERRMGKSPETTRKHVFHLMSLMDRAGYGSETHWWQGYYHYYLQDFDRSLTLFARAEEANADRKEYWLDRGRAEYNTARLTQALRSFRNAYDLARNSGRPIDGQHFRWLAKTYRWLGRPDDEAQILVDAMEYPWQGGTLEEETRQLAVRRAPRALLDARRPDDALEFIQEWYILGHRRQAELSAAKAEALCMLGRQDEALEYARRTAAKFRDGLMIVDASTGIFTDLSLHGGDPGDMEGERMRGGDLVLATALAHANMPFTAHSTLVEALKDAASTTDESTTVFMTTSEDPVSGTEFMTPVVVESAFLHAQMAGQRAYETGQADLATELYLEAAELALKQDGTIPLAFCLQRLNEIALNHPRLAQLHTEALQRFPDDGLVLLHAGRYHFARAQFDQALVLFDRARSTDAMSAVLAEALVAETQGRLGNQEEALRIFQGLLSRNWRTQKPDIVGQGIFSPAMRWAEQNGFHLQGLQWAEDWLKTYSNEAVTLKDAIPIYLSAGRSALALGQSAAAYTWFTRAAATYGSWLIDDDTAALRVSDMARAGAMVALSALLAGRHDDVEPWLETARSQGGSLDVVDLVSALAVAKRGDVEEAYGRLLDTESSPLWVQVARLVATECRSSGRADLAERLERKASIAAGTGPSLEDTLEQLGERNLQLLDARREADANREFRHLAHDVFDALVVRSGLFPEDHAAYRELKKALDTGRRIDPEKIALDVMEHRSKELRKAGVRGTLCEDRMREDWPRLQPHIRELLTLTQDHVAYVEQQELKDYGPALMYLAKTIEELVRDRIAVPLTHQARAMGGGVPWDKEFTLGTLPYLLGGRMDPSGPYASLFRTASTALPQDIQSYLRREWADDARQLARLRNQWVHSNVLIDREAFSRVVDSVVGPLDGRSLLSAALALEGRVNAVDRRA